jgi:hypothetical protein
MSPDQIQNKKVLISPLNWGYGHVSRCVGLIHQLLNQSNEVFVACDLNQRKVFETYFDSIQFIEHEGYPFEFKGKGHFTADLLAVYPQLRARLVQEISEVNEMVKKNEIDIVISDHRYGFRSTSVPSIFLTHQYHLPVRWFETFVSIRHRKYMRAFNEIWIMDYADSKLAGVLSTANGNPKICYIGPYSRFSMYELKDREKTLDKVLVASGPAVYAQKLIDNYAEIGDVVICDEELVVAEGIDRCSGGWKERDLKILQAKHLISHAGYSTIMDLEVLGISSTLIPTKGQREQEYLYTIHRSKKGM